MIKILINLPFLFLPISFVLTTEICHVFLKNKCKINKFTFLHAKTYSCECSDLNVNLTLSNSSYQIIKKAQFWDIRIFFKLKKPSIIDKKLQLFNQVNFNISSLSASSYSFLYVKGFDIDSFDTISNSQTNDIFYFYESTLRFYKNGQLLKSCTDFPLRPRSIFQAFNSFASRYFHFIIPKLIPICPISFSNVRITELNVFGLINTYYKRNILTFLDMSKEITNINSQISSVKLFGIKVQLNRQIINEYVFNQTFQISLGGEFTAIEMGTFKSMKNLRILKLEAQLCRMLFQRGIKWMLDLNPNVKIDFNSVEKLDEPFYTNSWVMINVIDDIYAEIRRYQKLDRHLARRVFPDEDFCVYEKFPFEHLIVVFGFELLKNGSQMTCTYAWLVQYYPKFPAYFYLQYFSFFMKINTAEIKELVKNCDFVNR